MTYCRTYRYKLCLLQSELSVVLIKNKLTVVFETLCRLKIVLVFPIIFNAKNCGIMQYKVSDQESQYLPKETSETDYQKLYKSESSVELTSASPTMFQPTVPALSSSPTASPTYQDPQTSTNLGYPSSMYVPGTRGVLPSMQYLSNSSQASSASFWGMQPELGYSHAHSGNNSSPIAKPFAFDPSQASTSPPNRTDGMNYSSPGAISRPNPYSTYMGADLSPWSMAIQQGLHRIGAGKLICVKIYLII